MTKQVQLKLDAIIKVIDTATQGNVKYGNRERHNVDARQIYFKIVNDHLRIPISHSANYIGKNHATGIHALKQFKNYFEHDKELRRKYTNCIDLLEDYDFNIDRTDNQDLLDDYITIMKKNQKLESDLEEFHQDIEQRINKLFVQELKNLRKETLNKILFDRGISDSLSDLLQDILDNRETLIYNSVK